MSDEPISSFSFVEANADGLCPFCLIFMGKRNANILRIWPWSENSPAVIALKPLNPVVPGHALIIPSEHILDASRRPKVSALLMECASLYSQNFPSSNIITSIGAAATQTVKHVHLHVVPREDGDGLKLPWTGQKKE